jgi:hypothetical protein
MTETPAVVTPAAEAKAPVVKMPNQNGVTRPKDGTATGTVWKIADEQSATLGKPAPRKDVIAAGVVAGINPATLATQYGRWRKFHGLGKEVKPVAEAQAASDVSVVPAEPVKQG